MSFSLAETEEERAKRHAWAEAVGARPEEEVMRDLVFPGGRAGAMDNPKWDGGYRWFKSPNVICLEKAREAREAKWSD
jgi:hypothetical protein